MRTPLPLLLAAALALAACQGSKQKTTWQKVTETKPDSLAAGGEAYTRKLHQMLTAENVEHKVVSYHYRYQTALREEAVGTHTAVIYKDESNPRNPWWLMNDRAGKPVWLPGDDVNRQVSFYLHRPAHVVELKDFDPTETPRETAVAQSPAAPSATRLAQAPAAPLLRPARFAPASHDFHFPFTTPPPAESRADDVFRRAHGTDYDPASPADRRKMELLKRASLDAREPAVG